ncbi:MAG TPA: hypothetical protein PLU52_03430 [Opitutaceae bacterium]|nr:hypothetical protein [Opitutaceae bacterium]HND61023.1 hypothetical protein [Opitutaceae bacterium]
MKRESLLLGLFLGVAVSVTVVLLSRLEPEHPPRRPPPTALSPPTETERAARAAYLTSYARRKFAPWLARLQAEHPGDLAERVATIVAERENQLAGAREAARQGGVTMDQYCDQVTAQVRAKLVAAGGESLGAEFDAYVATLPERLVVGSVNQVLAYRGAPLTVEQMDFLCAALHAHQAVPPSGRPSVTTWDAFLDRIPTAHQAVIEAVAPKLAPAQLEALREELELQRLRLRAQRRDVRLGQELAMP